MNALFKIVETGHIEGTGLHFIKGRLDAGVLEEHFTGMIDLGSRVVKIEVLGKSPIPITKDSTFRTYVLKVVKPAHYHLSDLIDKVMTECVQG